MIYLLTARQAGKTSTLVAGLYLVPNAYLIVATFTQKQLLRFLNPLVADRILSADEATDVKFLSDAMIWIDDLAAVLTQIFDHPVHTITDTPDAI